MAIPLIGEALAAGFGVIYVCDVDTLEAVKKPLVTEAIAVDAAIARGQLRLVTSTDVYLPDGTFQPDRTGRSTGAHRRKAAGRATPSSVSWAR